MAVVLVFEGIDQEQYEESVCRLTDGGGLSSPADWPVEGLPSETRTTVLAPLLRPVTVESAPPTSAVLRLDSPRPWNAEVPVANGSLRYLVPAATLAVSGGTVQGTIVELPEIFFTVLDRRRLAGRPLRLPQGGSASVASARL